MKNKKQKCIDCQRDFTVKTSNQVRGPKCEKKHGLAVYRDKQPNDEYVFKSVEGASDLIKDAILNNRINEQILAEALVNPEYREYLSTLLGREIKQEKNDTREYNNAFISKEDIQALGLMEGGVKDDVLPGEAMRIQGISELGNDGNAWLLNKMKAAIENKDYISFPFCKEISSDIRTKYLLRTDHTDTFDSIMNEIEEHRKKYINDEDWEIILRSMVASNKRINKEEVVFLNPLEEGVLGDVRPLSKIELKRYNLNDGAIADFRKDSHDLVSLKELSFVMKGEKVDNLSPFAGAFSKYLPELNQNGIRGIVFKVEDDKLVEIKLVKNNKKDSVPFGPVEAGITLVDFANESGTFTIKPNQKYYVCVSGFVAAPDIGKYSYTELIPENNKIVPASETFLFQQDEKEVLSTRLYFYPYKPSMVNPTYQTMSVIYGTSDQMFNSCANDPKGIYFNDEIKKIVSERIKSYGLDDEPAVKVAHRHYMDSDLPPETMYHNDDFHLLGKDVTDSILAENKFTVEKYLQNVNTKTYPTDSLKKVRESGILNNMLPLTSRFIVYNYLTNKNGGLTKEAQITTFRRLKRYDFKEVMEDFKMGMKLVKGLKEANDAIKKQGMDPLDAYDTFLDEEAKNYLEKGNNDENNE